MGRYLAFLAPDWHLGGTEPNENQVPPERTPFPVPSDAPLSSVRAESSIVGTFHIKLLMGIEIAHKLKVLDQQTQINPR